jgi:polysaccharide export outer membrane protein
VARSACLSILAMLAAAATTVGGCATMSAPPAAMVAQETPASDTAASDLDSYIYARSALTANAHAVPAEVAAVPQVAVSQVAVSQVAVSQVAVEAVEFDPMAAFVGEPPYRLDSGDRLRVLVFGQEGLTNSYTVDANGAITMPLIKSVKARGLTTEQLARLVTDRLRGGYVREPHVAIEIEVYRPFFILGEVTVPGQYAYVPHMTAENAVAIAGGFTPRAYRRDIKLDRPATGGVIRNTVPLLTRIRPGDTIIVKERWF